MRITTYKELDEFIKAFAEGHLGFVVVISRGGLGKSERALQTLKDALVFKGRASAVAIHNTLAENPKSLVVLDDIPALFSDGNTLATLLQVCETKEDKLVTYHTASPLVLEQQFISNNKVLVLANSLKHKNPLVEALLTRGLMVRFEPSNDEVMSQLREWGEDKEIVEFIAGIGRHVPLNFRMYMTSVALKNAGLDWKNYLHKEYEMCIDEEVVRNIQLLPVPDRNKQWVEATGKSTRTYLRIYNAMVAEGRL